MNEKTKRGVLILCILAILVFLFFKFNERIKLVELTSINVETENQLETEKVIVYQGYYTINRKNDAEMFDNEYDQVVFDGNGTGKIKTDYGENDFLVTYDNKYYFQFRQICTNDNDYYKYNLKILKKANKIHLKADIDGGMKFERQMNLISDAEKLRCNKIIDDEKGHYNGLELD
ncbi:hypothetical protein [Flavobacterium sp. HNIBRBA15423]|uniref:hypothetical protein n=1 Tax=Flavobacterium sp. HNIBRBA15423 TaxID=3458683 RepID=UPI004044529D